MERTCRMLFRRNWIAGTGGSHFSACRRSWSARSRQRLNWIQSNPNRPIIGFCFEPNHINQSKICSAFLSLKKWRNVNQDGAPSHSLYQSDQTYVIRNNQPHRESWIQIFHRRRPSAMLQPEWAFEKTNRRRIWTYQSYELHADVLGFSGGILSLQFGWPTKSTMMPIVALFVLQLCSKIMLVRYFLEKQSRKLGLGSVGFARSSALLAWSGSRRFGTVARVTTL